jgi:UDP-GlcNAc:undecaprenyl-phosphate/decaprenyl-phosphate GlcNAc-1-phosphate transferase
VELLVALIVTLVAAPVVRRVALRLGIVDHPGPLKTHRRPVPYLGGVAVLLGLLVGPIRADRLALLVPYGLALALGAADDALDLTPRARLAAEVVIGAVAAAVVPGPMPVKVATAVLVVVLLNAVNLLDGQDGLAAGVCLVSAASFAILGGDATTIGLALTGALGAFLVFNAPPARMYLGDGGAYLIGTVLATLPALTERGSSDWSVWIAVPLIVGVPLAGTAIAILRRALTHRPLLEGDRSHVYDQLVARGWRVETSTALAIMVQGVLGALGVLAAGLALDWALAIAGVTLVAMVALAASGGFLGHATD